VFNGGITVVDTSATFFLCRIFGTFTGPASSYRVDAPTIFAHATTLAGGATLSLQQEPVPLLTTTLTIPGGNGVGTVGDLNSSPVLLLASPGAGLAHIIHRVQWMLDYGTVGYDGAVGNLKLVYGTVASDPEAHTGPLAVGFVNQTVDTFSMTGLQGEILIQTDPVSVAATADFFGAAGDSPIKLKVWYETITLAL
jgi:hypothetical protein